MDAAFKGMRPAVVALIVVPVISLAPGDALGHVRGDRRVGAGRMVPGWSPIYILIAAAAIGIAWTLFIAKKAGK